MIDKGNAAKDWLGLVENSSLSNEKLKEKLQNIYRNNLPSFAEIVINPGCMNNCKHCIYNKEYACFNKALPLGEWEKIVDDMHDRLKFRHFIFGGRGMNRDIIEITKYIKKKHSDTKVGMIAEAYGLNMYWDEIKNLELDHLDISVDGMKKSHDEQRNKKGAFDLTIKMFEKLMDKDGPVKTGKFKKLSILSTLTAINKDDILPMFKFFNSKFGVKNFFITPLTVYAGHPDPSLKLEYPEVVEKLRETMKFFEELNNAYVGFSSYSDDLCFYMKKHDKDLWDRLTPTEDYFEFEEIGENSEFHFFWYPAAINGCREFIMNVNGDIFTGLVVVYKEIPKKNIFGNYWDISGDRKEFFERVIDNPAFDFFVEQVKRLRN